MIRVCHVSSVHRMERDVRILPKECVSLAVAGYEVHLVICAGQEAAKEAALKGVHIHRLAGVSSRFERMVKQTWRCFSLARRIDAAIYHFHDPELIPWGMLLVFMGKKVVYDVHEDVPKQILSKAWIPAFLRSPLSSLVAAIEWLGARFFFSIVAATPSIRDRFKRINPDAIDINNFPLIGELDSVPIDWRDKQLQVAYVGGITRIRGIQEIAKAMTLVRTGVRLQVAGTFSEPSLERQVKGEPGWKLVDELGFVDRAGVAAVLQRAIAGLVTYHPAPNHVDAQPNKMFEYMSAGVPVIASNFPLWLEIIEGSRCGICVDPSKPQEIAEAIDYLASHPSDGEHMGRNGQAAVKERYNWSVEEKKLLEFYRMVAAA
ncbi:MAG: hypothetical protein NAOJABEB_00112 [Steroidobacteraceae bacterium]|nr:hypothetical protein [Steroidobacteraceae bacterium]